VVIWSKLKGVYMFKNEMVEILEAVEKLIVSFRKEFGLDGGASDGHPGPKHSTEPSPKPSLGSIIELDLVLPYSNNGGLFFNEQKVHARFEKQGDGWWQSRGILFTSARSVEGDTHRDILMEYLSGYAFASCIREQLPEGIFGRVDEVEVSLPKESQGTKQYHGVNCWYWLADRSTSSAFDFCGVSRYGLSGTYSVNAVGETPPTFRVKGFRM
jgi:hypothetical protein